MEAEYLYRKVDDSKALSDVSADRRKISLEEFQIIKVIGKGIITKFNDVTFFFYFTIKIIVLYRTYPKAVRAVIANINHMH